MCQMVAGAGEVELWNPLPGASSIPPPLHQYVSNWLEIILTGFVCSGDMDISKEGTTYQCSRDEGS